MFAMSCQDHAYAGTTVTFQLLRANGWGEFVNLGFFLPWDWLQPTNLRMAQERLARRSLKFLGIRRGDEVLDVASGRGRGAYLAATLYPTSKVVGVDLIEDHVRVSRLLYGGMTNLQFLQGRAENLPFHAETFDCLHSLESAFHFERVSFLREAYRVLRPGGRLAVIDFMWRSAQSREVLSTKESEIVRSIWDFEDFWSVDEYLSGARNAGFTLIAQDDWSSQVTGALQRRFSAICRLGAHPVTRSLLCVANPILRSFGSEDWNLLSAQARAHDTMRRRSRYIALVFEKPSSRSRR